MEKTLLTPNNLDFFFFGFDWSVFKPIVMSVYNVSIFCLS